jgi:hypothetical protein
MDAAESKQPAGDTHKDATVPNNSAERRRQWVVGVCETSSGQSDRRARRVLTSHLLRTCKVRHSMHVHEANRHHAPRFDRGAAPHFGDGACGEPPRPPKGHLRPVRAAGRHGRASHAAPPPGSRPRAAAPAGARSPRPRTRPWAARVHELPRPRYAFPLGCSLRRAPLRPNPTPPLYLLLCPPPPPPPPRPQGLAPVVRARPGILIAAVAVAAVLAAVSAVGVILAAEAESENRRSSAQGARGRPHARVRARGGPPS